MHSLKSFFDLLMPEYPGLALALSLGGSAALLTALVRLATSPSVWIERTLPLFYAFASVVGVLIDPHIFDYDLTVLVFAALLVGTIEPPARWWFLGFYVLLFLREPVPVGDQFFQPTVLVLVAFALWLWRHLGRLSQTPANERLT